MTLQRLLFSTLILTIPACDFSKSSDDDDWGDEADWDGSTEEPWSSTGGGGNGNAGGTGSGSTGGGAGDDEADDWGGEEMGGEEMGGEEMGGADGDDSMSRSCRFGADICIETTAEDPGVWCDSEGGTSYETACDEDYTSYCDIPSDGSEDGTWANAATAYYYNDFDGEEACIESAGGTFTDVDDEADGGAEDTADGDDWDGGDWDGDDWGGDDVGDATDGETSGGDTDGDTSGDDTDGSSTGPEEEATDDEREPLEDVVEGDEATDNDGDGFSEEDGDCDDTDATVYPGADEACDGIDTSCDGYRDLEFWDDFEPNDDFDTATDLGDIDSWVLGSTIDLRLEDLNFDYADDEDWFVWNANDAWYDDPTIRLTVESDAITNIDVILYVLRTSDEGDYSAMEVLVEKSRDGVTSVVITEDDFPREEGTGAWWEGIWDSVTGWFDGSDDFFYVKISTDSTWTEDDCEETLYNLTIES